MTARRARILVLGADGQLGWELRHALAFVGEVVAHGRSTLDVSDLATLRAALRSSRFDVVVNAAAHTDVDGAERDESAARLLNVEVVRVLGEASLAEKFALVHYSTDFVFDGEQDRAYREDDPVAPLSAYGRSKLEGERALAELGAPALVLRTAWVWSLRRKSFVSTMLRLAREREALSVVDDQLGNPTFAGDLAQATALVLHELRADLFGGIDAAKGVYHVAGAGIVSRYDFARAIFAADPRKAEHTVRAVLPVDSSRFPLPAKRPKYAPLDCAKLRARFGVELPDWQASLARALNP